MQYAPGFSATDLTQQDRQAFRQNTGCRITVVYENTVAFYANLFPGDIITRINGRDIYTTKDLYEVRSASKIGDTWDMTFVRNGQLYRVVMKYDLYYPKQHP
jgi:S1-C subfamily serine protease